METGVRIMPLSVGLLVAALGVPKCSPTSSERRVRSASSGCSSASSGYGRDRRATRRRGVGALLVVGLGIGCLASQLARTTSSLRYVQPTCDDQVGRPAHAGSIALCDRPSSHDRGLQVATTGVQADGRRRRGERPASTTIAVASPFVSDAQVEQP